MEGAALIALEDMPPERFGAAASDIHKGSAVRRQHAITEALQIRWPVLSKNLCELRHGRVFQSWAMSALRVTLKVSMTFWVRWAYRAVV